MVAWRDEQCRDGGMDGRRGGRMEGRMVLMEGGIEGWVDGGREVRTQGWMEG